MKNKQKFIGSIGIFFILLVCMFVGYKISKPKEINMKEMFVDGQDNVSSYDKKSGQMATNLNGKAKTTSNTSNSESENKNAIKVCISGDVKHPDMYSLKNGSRLKDLINASGGVLEDAELSSVNLAQKLKDEDYIYIPKKGEVEPLKPQNSETQSFQNNKASEKKSTKDRTGKININTANKTELMSISGIGETKAQKIIEYREKNGEYKSIDELKEIGARIGDKTLEKLRDYIDVK